MTILRRRAGLRRPTRIRRGVHLAHALSRICHLNAVKRQSAGRDRIIKHMLLREFVRRVLSEMPMTLGGDDLDPVTTRSRIYGGGYNITRDELKRKFPDVWKTLSDWYGEPYTDNVDDEWGFFSVGGRLFRLSDNVSGNDLLSVWDETEKDFRQLATYVADPDNDVFVPPRYREADSERLSPERLR